MKLREGVLKLKIPTNGNIFVFQDNKIMDIDNKLKEYNYFQECIIEDIIFSDFGTSVSISFNNIWLSEKRIRNDLGKKIIVTIKFHLVNRFIVQNELSDVVLDDPQSMNWGINEISKVDILETSDKKFNIMEILWESKRKIIIECKEISIV